MTTTPIALLDSWGSSLGFLEDAIAVGIGGIARRLDLAMATDGPRSKGQEEPNGFGGLSRSGDLSRLLLSDWALADLAPDEFLRRFVSAELSYLDVEYDAPHSTQSIAVLIDAGPHQLGARRLVQLAGLAALDRRTRALGIPLMLGVAGDSSRTWHTGELPELFSTWLRARTSLAPSLTDLNGWIDDPSDDIEAWLFGATSVDSSMLDARWKRLSAVESRWVPGGATHLDATVNGRPLELPLPSPEISLRLLRGHGLRRKTSQDPARTSGHLRFPQMRGSGRRLMCRGDSDDLLLAVTIPQEPERQVGKIKRHWFAGPVLAASFVGARTVALVANQGRLEIAVVGKRLGQVDKIDIAASEVGLDAAAIDRICDEGLAQLQFHSGTILVELDDQWWSIPTSDEPRKESMVAVAASTVIDQPRVVTRLDSRIFVDRQMLDARTPEDVRILLGPGTEFALERDEGLWDFPLHNHDPIQLPPDTLVHGLTRRLNRPTLVTQSAGGHILRLIGPGSETTTLTAWSNDVAGVAVHPTLSLLAIQRLDGSIDVLDVASEASRLARIEPEQ